MACWSAIIVGAIALGLILFDLITEKWEDLLYHGGIGAGGTILFWAICYFLGEQISFGIFIVPAVVFCMFLLSSWLFTHNLKQRGCCVKCVSNGSNEGPSPNTPTPPNPPSPPNPPTPSTQSICEPVRLNATTAISS